VRPVRAEDAVEANISITTSQRLEIPPKRDQDTNGAENSPHNQQFIVLPGALHRNMQ
jgi:hypothetical protein